MKLSDEFRVVGWLVAIMGVGVVAAIALVPLQRPIEFKVEEESVQFRPSVTDPVSAPGSPPTSPPPAERSRPRVRESQIHAEVAVLCQYAVERQLRAPATADFPFALSADVIKLDSGAYRLASYVDAQNAFGAQIRTDFICEASGEPGSMRATAILLPR